MNQKFKIGMTKVLHVFYIRKTCNTFFMNIYFMILDGKRVTCTSPELTVYNLYPSFV